MKAILEFNLDDPDERKAHQRCTKSLDMALALWQFQHNSRKTIEEEAEKVSPLEAIDLVYKAFNELMEEHNIMLDDLIE